jgi:hypothetical protein
MRAVPAPVAASFGARATTGEPMEGAGRDVSARVENLRLRALTYEAITGAGDPDFAPGPEASMGRVAGSKQRHHGSRGWLWTILRQRRASLVHHCCRGREHDGATTGRVGPDTW